MESDVGENILLIGPGFSLEELDPNILKSTPSLYFGSSFHWFEKNNVCPTYWTFIDPNTVTYFDTLINGLSKFDELPSNKGRYDYKYLVDYLKTTPPYSKNFLTYLFESTTLMYGDLQTSKDFYNKGLSTSRGIRWFEGEYKDNVLPRVKSYFKKSIEFPQVICVNNYSSSYIPTLKNIPPLITHGPTTNTDKFVCYILPLVLTYFKGLKRIDCIGFGDFNNPRLFNNTSEGYGEFKLSYERMKDPLINLLNFKNISISFQNKNSYFIELENNINKNNIN